MWGCMSAAGVGELHFIDGIMNSQMYCSILKEKMLPSLRALDRRALFQHDCNEVDIYGKKEAGTGEHLTFNNKINKLKRKAAAPHGRLPHTKHKQKFQAWSSLVFHCCHSSFNPSEAPPWDSRPVSGAGVVHYQLLHRPRSVPKALGPPHSSHTPLAGRGVLPRLRSTPPPPSPGGSPSGRPRRTWG